MRLQLITMKYVTTVLYYNPVSDDCDNSDRAVLNHLCMHGP